MSQDLNLIPTSELLDEIFSRFDHSVFKGCKKETDKNYVNTFDFFGDHAICSGMCNELIHEINRHHDEVTEKLDEAP